MKTFVLFGTLLGSSVYVVFASALKTEGHIPYAQEAALAVSLGALIWILKHLFTVTQPRQEKMFRETLDKIVQRSDQHHADHLEKSERSSEAIDKLSTTCRDFQTSRNCPEQKD